AESRGLGLADTALQALGASTEPPDVREERSQRPARGAVRVDPEQVAAELRTAQRELMASRADVTEVDG
ncbi:MAG: hypothetical protein GWM92_07135, partial [Gemmatimonadetes bacterium]|nr:hypothetical protein [Gemmatimonadota bacterium]NIT87007.1 hypothetical protein [Gemmatimonadota bacterium]NIU76523.1 hypothetical protein [Gammaproteobacteria bacterium]NIY10748.1 hypothetical protein [Gemmatimonadota bacterium]NIY39220.1 hypothetical protein [Gemmatimonadota bacterium]